MHLAAFVASFAPLAVRLTLSQTLIYALPWSIVFSFFGQYTTNFEIWNMSYFYIIVYYLRIKICNINCKLKSIINANSNQINSLLCALLKSLNEIFIEIGDYNRIYWSKCLFAIIAIYLTVINTLIYLAIFGEINLLLRICFIYAATLFVCITSFLMTVAASLTHEVVKTYKLLNILLARKNSTNRLTIGSKIKVIN